MTQSRPKSRTQVELPETVSSRIEFKRKFSFWQMYRSFVALPWAATKLLDNNRRALVDEDLVRRLQLAVTEVNGCPACSYQHAKMALRQGMSNEEISSFLSGSGDYIKPEEGKAILFAQHFAESTGRPEQYAYDRVAQEYGDDEAHIMLAGFQFMLAGNAYGIPYSAFQSRRKGRPFRDSSLVYEVGMLMAGFVVLPVAILHGSLRGLFGSPVAWGDEGSEAPPGFSIEAAGPVER